MDALHTTPTNSHTRYTYRAHHRVKITFYLCPSPPRSRLGETKKGNKKAGQTIVSPLQVVLDVKRLSAAAAIAPTPSPAGAFSLSVVLGGAYSVQQLLHLGLRDHALALVLR